MVIPSIIRILIMVIINPYEPLELSYIRSLFYWFEGSVSDATFQCRFLRFASCNPKSDFHGLSINGSLDSLFHRKKNYIKIGKSTINGIFNS